MSENGNNRFILRWLNKERADEAWAGELLSDKKSGEVLMKTTQGDVVGLDYLDRLENQLATAQNAANMYGFVKPCLHVIKNFYRNNGEYGALGDKFTMPITTVGTSNLFPYYGLTDYVSRPNGETITKYIIIPDVTLTAPASNTITDIELDLDDNGQTSSGSRYAELQVYHYTVTPENISAPNWSSNYTSNYISCKSIREFATTIVTPPNDTKCLGINSFYFSWANQYMRKTLNSIIVVTDSV